MKFVLKAYLNIKDRSLCDFSSTQEEVNFGRYKHTLCTQFKRKLSIKYVYRLYCKNYRATDDGKPVVVKKDNNVINIFQFFLVGNK